MPTLLIVDDNDSIRRLIRKILERIDFQAEEAKDGLEAIEILRQRRFDGIILDLMMPRANGFAVLEFLKNERPEALKTTIILTADSTRWEDASLSHVHRVVKKPFSLDELVPVIRECVSGSRV